MPKVQSILSEYFGKLPLGLHLNGDEAMALGGAFVAANRSSAYRVKKIGAIDVSPFSVAVNITSSGADDEPVQEPAAAADASAAEDADGEDAAATEESASTPTAGKAWFKHSQIFPRHSAVGTSKKIAFRHAHDIQAVLFHDQPETQRLPGGSRCV